VDVQQADFVYGLSEYGEVHGEKGTCEINLALHSSLKHVALLGSTVRASGLVMNPSVLRYRHQSSGLGPLLLSPIA